MSTSSPATRSPPPLRRRLVYLLVLFGLIEGGARLADHVFGYHRRVVLMLGKLRIETEPSLGVPSSPSETTLWVRSPDDGPSPEAPYQIGGRQLDEAGPWIERIKLEPDSAPGQPGRRVFVVGGSAAFGFPYRHADSFPGMLDRHLGSHGLPVLNASLVGAATDDLVPVVDCLCRHYDPHTLVIFAGNNEWFYWRPATVPENRDPGDSRPPPLGRTSLGTLELLAHSRALAAAEFAMLKWIEARHRRPHVDVALVNSDDFQDHYELTGVDYALSQPLDPDRYDPGDWPATRQKYLDTFRDNLTRMVKTGQDRGAHVILLTVPFNYRLSPAWKHRQPDSFDRTHREGVRGLTAEAARLMRAGQHDDALPIVRAAIALDPLPPVPHYLAAQCLEALGRLDEAEQEYAASREHMIGNLGSRLSINDTIAEVAEDTRATLVDVRRIFDEYEHGLGGHFNSLLIKDDCHPTPLGHDLIAAAVLPLVLNPPKVEGPDEP